MSDAVALTAHRRGNALRISQRKLMAKEFPNLRFLLDTPPIPDTGLVMFGGKKKRGKSYWILQHANVLALKRRVLYFALEDGERRINRRLREQGANPNARITYRWTLNLEGGENRASFEAEASRYRVVIVDNLARVKSSKTDENSSGSMGDIVHWLQELAMRLSVLIIIVHHHGKAETGDPGDDLRGSSALGAAGDLNIGLYFTAGNYILRGEGRDIDEFEYRLKRDPTTRTWAVLGNEHSLALEQSYEELRDAMGEGEVDVQDVAGALEITYRAAQQRLKKAVEAGCVTRRVDSRGATKARAYLYQWVGIE